MISYNNLIIWSILICFSTSLAKLTKPHTGKCECAAFSIRETELIFSFIPMITTCDAKGRNMCLNVCNYNGRLNASEIFCDYLSNSDPIEPMMFIRICNEDWIYGNVYVDRAICCFEGLPVSCEVGGIFM